MTAEDADPGEARDFERVRELGRGGMGVVYEALSRRTGERVALKRLLDEVGGSLLLFKNEFRALADLVHPNLVQLFELHGEGTRWYFTMELVEGARPFVEALRAASPQDPTGDVPTLATLAGETGSSLALCAHAAGSRCDTARLGPALAQLAQGLAALHARGLVHRDLKPSNVLVDAEGRVVLTDFGLVAESDAARSARGPLGTPLYMAPEQAEGRPATAASDWYAVGAMLFECLTGAPPYAREPTLDALFAAKLLRDPPPVASLVGDLDARLAGLCDALLAREPSQRPGLPEVLSALDLDARDALWTGAPPFVGRARELEALRAAFEARPAEPVLLALEGPSGLGKSSLARAYARSLDAAHLVLEGRCHAREHVAFSAFDGAIDALARALATRPAEQLRALEVPDGDALAQSFPVLREVSGLLPEAAPSNESASRQRARAFDALRATLSRLCERERVLLVLDDVQWADGDSRALLTALLAPPHAPPLRVLLTVRGEARDVPWLYALPAPLAVQTLGPLPESEARSLLERLGDTARLAPRLLDEARGHPLLLTQLGLELAGAARSTASSPSTFSLEGLLQRRAATLPPRALELLEVLSLAGAPLSPALAAEAAGLAPGELGPATSALRAAHLAVHTGTGQERALEPAHARLSELVSAALSQERRLALHASLARTLERAEGATSPGLLVRHLEAAGETLRAATIAEAQAHRATAQLAFEQAAELYRLALRIHPPTGEALARLRNLLGEALMRCGRPAEAAEAFLGAAEQLEGRARLRARVRAVQQLLDSGDSTRGLALLKRIAADAGVSMPGTHAQGALSLLYHRAQLRLRGSRRAPPGTLVSEETSLRLELLSALGRGLAQLGMVQGEDMQARALLLAMQCGEPRALSEALLFESNFHRTSFRPEDRAHSERLHAEGTRLAQRLGDPMLEGYAAFTAGFSSMLDGELALAEAHLARAEAMPALREDSNFYRHNLMTVGLITRALFAGGDLHLRAWIEQHERETLRNGTRFTQAQVQALGPLLWIMLGDVERSEKALREPAWRPSPQEGGPSGRFSAWWEHFHLWTRTRVALYRAEPEVLRGVLGELREASRGFLMRVVRPMRLVHDHLQGSAALALAARRYDPALLREARRCAARLRPVPSPVALPFAELLDAGAAALEGRPSEALARLFAGRRAALAAGLRGQGHAAGYWLGERSRAREATLAQREALEWYALLGVRDARRVAWHHAPGLAPEGAPPVLDPARAP